MTLGSLENIEMGGGFNYLTGACDGLDVFVPYYFCIHLKRFHFYYIVFPNYFLFI